MPTAWPAVRLTLLTFSSVSPPTLHTVHDPDLADQIRTALSILTSGRRPEAPAEARQRHIVNVLCDFCGKSFPNSWAYERHRTCTKLKGSLKNRLLLASYAQSGAIGNPSWYHGNGHAFSKSFTRPQRFLRLDSKISEISTWPAYFYEISSWVSNFAFFKNLENMTNTPTGSRIPSGVRHILTYF